MPRESGHLVDAWLPVKLMGSQDGSCLPLLGPDSARPPRRVSRTRRTDRKSTRLNSSHLVISYAVFCLKKKKNQTYGKSSTAHQKSSASDTSYRSIARTIPESARIPIRWTWDTDALATRTWDP